MDDATRLERLLCDTLLRFWNSAIRDERGGYRLNHDRFCVWQGPAPKALVTQARTLWFFSRLCSSQFGTPEHERCAHHGFEFLTARMLDHAHGGFFWEVDDTGTQVTKPAKHLYAQAFALYALSEYAAAFDDERARALANDLFALIDSKARDAEYGGYVECFSRDWQSPAASGYLGADPPLKLLNTHLHLLEAMTRYYEDSGNPAARERVIELIVILTNAVVRMENSSCTDVHRRDWSPVLDGSAAQVSYGHDLELGWMLLKACKAVEMPQYPLHNLVRSITDSALAFGFDRKHGGFYHTGPLGKPARDRSKVWWVQAEALLALASLWRLTSEERYRAAFSRTLDWIWKRQADWEYGEWFARIERGRAMHQKAGAWKGPYHQGRALLECLALLRGD